MINLSKRLKSVACFVLKEPLKGVIDVGCDHALLDIYLVQNKSNLKVVASDNKKLPLENARKNIIKYSCVDKIEISLSDGIENIDDDIDTVVIAGMGAETIIEILQRGKNKLNHVNRLIISSNNKYEMIRKKINKLGYTINDEKIIFEDNKYYVVMEFSKGKKIYTKKELYFGPVLLKHKDELFYQYFRSLKEEQEKILNMLKENNIKKTKVVKEVELLNEEC